MAWLYVTRDGTLGSLDADHRFVPMANPCTALPMQASEENPLTARVAWWCDDTTCKLNINTASEGVFWDTPRCDTNEERAYGTSQPARGEWQRDMGHPAAVCLSSVLFPGHRLHVPGTTSALASLPLDSGRAIWRNAPGIPDGGSLGGTVAVNPAPEGAVEEPVLELFANGVDLAEAENLPPDARARAARSGFFLTARSRAPDYGLDGAPRVSLWPLASPHWQSAVSGEATPASGLITEFDALMAEVSSLHFNGTRQPMAIVRANARSQFEDLDDLERGLYPHLTTRSLTFDLHLVAEEIRKDASTPSDRFVPGADQAVGRVRWSLPLTGRIDPKDPAMPDFIWDDRQALSLPTLDSFIVWSVPGVAPVKAAEPILTDAAMEGNPESDSGRLLVRWSAAPSQTCLLESSTDMVSWSPRGRFRTGESRDLMYGDSHALSDARQAEVFLFVPKGTATLYVRLRWEPPPSDGPE